MYRLGKMREAADLLLRHGKYSEAFEIYDELYRQIWGIFGSVRWSYNSQSNYLFKPAAAAYRIYWEKHIESSANVMCLRIYNIGLKHVLEEFINVIFGRLQCMCFSNDILRKADLNNILNEFNILYTLVYQSSGNRRIAPLFNMVSILLDGNRRLKKITPNCPRSIIEKQLIENVQKKQYVELKGLNNLLLECLFRKDTVLYNRFVKTAGKQYYRYRYRGQHSYWNDWNEQNGKSSCGTKEFCPATATDEEKKAYYGKIIDLKGEVTKAQIRSKYLDLISLYHPDKVAHLGPELRKLAELKSKEINAAYDWFKSRYHI